MTNSKINKPEFTKNNSENNKNHIGNLLKNKGIFKTLLILSAPLFVIFVSDSIFMFIDSWMIYNYVDSSSETILPVIKSITFSYYKFFLAFGFLFLIGVSMFYSYKTGKGEQEHYLKRIISNGALGTLLISVTFMTTMALSVQSYLKLMSNTALTANVDQQEFLDLIPSVWQYITLFGFGGVFVLMRNNYMRILRIEGNSIKASIITFSFFPLWMFLDWIFMGVGNMGFMGAGLAYFISSVFTFLITIIFVKYLQRRNQTLISFKLNTFKLDKKIMTTIFLLSVPTTIWSLGFTSNEVTQSWIFASLDSTDANVANIFAAYQLSVLFSQSFTVTITTVMAMLIGYMIGQKMHEENKRLLRISAISIIGVNLFVLLILNVLYIQIASLVKIPDASYGTVNYQVWLLLTISLTVFQSQGFMSTFTTASKNIRVSVTDSIIKFFLLGIPLQLIFFFGIYVPTGENNVFNYIGYLPIWSVLSAIYLTTKYISIKRRILN